MLQSDRPEPPEAPRKPIYVTERMVRQMFAAINPLTRIDDYSTGAALAFEISRVLMQFNEDQLQPERDQMILAEIHRLDQQQASDPFTFPLHPVNPTKS